MAKWTKEAVEELLEERMEETVARNKAHGLKTSVGDLAHSLAPLVIAMMSDSRRREVGNSIKAVDALAPKNQEHLFSNELVGNLERRRRELKIMAEVLWKHAKAR